MYAVSYTGLPAGLAVTLRVVLLNCSSGSVFIPAGAAPMTETSFTTYESVQTPTGPVIRAVVITTYAAQIRPTWSKLASPCGAAYGNNLEFSASVAGENSLGLPAVKSYANLAAASLASGPFSLTTRLEGKSGPPQFGTSAINPLQRGPLMTMTVRHQSPGGLPERPVMEFVPPQTSFSLITPVTARLFVRADGKRCITAGGSTVCNASGVTFEHGGVQLRAIQHPAPLVATGTDFSFKLTSAFPVGSYTIRTSADDADLPAYLVDGEPASLNLLRWLSGSQTVNVY